MNVFLSSQRQNVSPITLSLTPVICSLMIFVIVSPPRRGGSDFHFVYCNLHLLFAICYFAIIYRHILFVFYLYFIWLCLNFFFFYYFFFLYYLIYLLIAYVICLCIVESSNGRIFTFGRTNLAIAA